MIDIHLPAIGFVLLVDDNPGTNVLNADIIREAADVEELVCTESASEALHLLNERKAQGKSMPDLIFLDVMMPQRSGWDFLNDYQNAFGETRKGSVVMLTSSTNVRDVIKCAVHPEIQDYITKPLSDMEAKRIVAQYTWQIGLKIN